MSLMHKVFFNLFLLTLFACSCQEKSSQSDNYNQYYEILTKAEDLAFTDEKYNESLSLFKEAFASVEYVFAFDLENALEVALLSKDIDFAFVLSERLIQNGVILNFFDKPIYSVLKQDKSRWNTLKKSFPNIRAKYLKTVDQELRKNLLELRELDSLLNNEWHSKKLSKDYFLSKFENLGKEFRDLVKNHEFPSEKRIGIYTRNNQISSAPYYIMIIHQYQMGNTVLTEEELDILVRKGELHESEKNMFLNLMPAMSMEETISLLLDVKWRNK